MIPCPRSDFLVYIFAQSFRQPHGVHTEVCPSKCSSLRPRVLHSVGDVEQSNRTYYDKTDGRILLCLYFDLDFG